MILQMMKTTRMTGKLLQRPHHYRTVSIDYAHSGVIYEVSHRIRPYTLLMGS